MMQFCIHVHTRARAYGCECRTASPASSASPPSQVVVPGIATDAVDFRAVLRMLATEPLHDLPVADLFHRDQFVRELVERQRLMRIALHAREIVGVELRKHVPNFGAGTGLAFL